MTTPWTPLLGDIGVPATAGALAVETAARVAADAVLQAEIAGFSGSVSSVFGRVGAVTKQLGDYNFADLGIVPSDVAGYGITDVYTKTASDARYQTPQTTLAGYGITDAYTKTASDLRYQTPQTTLAGYGIGDAYTKTASDARFSPIAVPWANITGAPTTIAGYSISDAYTKTLSDARYLRDIPILGSDTFPQVASTALSTLATGQSWVMWNGAWVATGANQAKENGSVRDAAVVWDTGLTEQDWTIYAANGAVAVGIPGIICRGVSAGNYIFAKWTNGLFSINKMVGGVITLLTSVAATSVVNVAYKMRIVATGNVITATIDGPTGTFGTSLSYTLVGAEITLFGPGTFVGNYISATSGTNANHLFSNVAFRNYLNTQIDLDARYLRIDAIGQTIAPNAPNGTTAVGLAIGQQLNQCGFKVWGQLILGNNNDVLNNSTGSGFLHVGSFAGVTLGLSNGTVYLKAVAAGISAPTGPFIQTTGGAPALATSSGVTGQFAWANGFFYVCVAANTWQRVALATF